MLCPIKFLSTSTTWVFLDLFKEYLGEFENKQIIILIDMSHYFCTDLHDY